MRIKADAADRFLQLYMRLQLFAGQRRDVLPEKMSWDDFLDTPLSVKIACRDKIYEPSPLLDDFLLAQSDTLTLEEHNIVADWRRFVRGTFLVLRHLKQYSVFIHSTSPSCAYGVLSLSSDLTELVPMHLLPISVKTVLLPYEGVIVCDGLLNVYGMKFGSNMRSNFNEEYKEMKSTGRFFTVL